jgi:hypothetical protein
MLSLVLDSRRAHCTSVGNRPGDPQAVWYALYAYAGIVCMCDFVICC